MADAITLETLHLLPELERLRELCKALAILDAMIEPEWQLRYFSFDSKWDEGEEMASMRDGCGSDHHCLFINDGAILKGFDVDSEFAEDVVEVGAPPIGVFENVPSEFDSFLVEPAFAIEQSTYCIWRRRSDLRWCSGVPEDEHDRHAPLGLLHMLQDDPSVYQRWAEEYYGREFPIEPIAAAYRMEPISESTLKRLNPNLTLGELEADIEEIGYRQK